MFQPIHQEIDSTALANASFEPPSIFVSLGNSGEPMKFGALPYVRP